MPHLDDEQLQALARLARLDLTAADREALGSDLERILDYVAGLAAFDDPSAEPLRHPNLGAGGEPAGLQPAGLPPDDLRPDVPAAGLPRSALEAMAPAWRDDRVEVPRTVDQDG
ncbi:MAG: Asp-tRNA(Asn)/Glu-tRNA(Gln) amidotransferase subunit GatC [Trueperaceae bacterium]